MQQPDKTQAENNAQNDGKTLKSFPEYYANYCYANCLQESTAKQQCQYLCPCNCETHGMMIRGFIWTCKCTYLLANLIIQTSNIEL